MASRPKIPDDIQTELFKRCRRRCCICYGLRFDEEEKKGQIAHLDRIPTNHDQDNLAWLCHDHHDQYDSKPSQSKGLTKGEVKAYRSLLHERIVLKATGADTKVKIVEHFEEILDIKAQRIQHLEAEIAEHEEKAKQLQTAVDQAKSELGQSRQQLNEAKQSGKSETIVDALGMDAAIRRIVTYEPGKQYSPALANLLRWYGYEVASAKNMVELHALVSANSFDLLLADPYTSEGGLVWNKPLCDLMTELHKKGTWGIAWSATSSGNEAAWAKAAGFTLFLDQPSTIEIVLKAISLVAATKFEAKKITEVMKAHLRRYEPGSIDAKIIEEELSKRPPD